MALLVCHTEIAALRETIAILSDPLAVLDVRQAEQDALAGCTVNAEEILDSSVVSSYGG